MIRLVAHGMLAVALMAGHAPCAIACAATATPSDLTAAADCHGPHASDTHAAAPRDPHASDTHAAAPRDPVEATGAARPPQRSGRTRAPDPGPARHEAPASVCGECESPWGPASSEPPTARAGRVPATPARAAWTTALVLRLEDGRRRAPPPGHRIAQDPYRASNPPLLR